eukprot:jgi/Mesen1/8622/ME000050S08035
MHNKKPWAAGPSSMNVIYYNTFVHDEAGDNVDEVKFEQPVIVSACHVVDLHESPHPHLFKFEGATSPPSFTLEVYVRSAPKKGRKQSQGRFKRLCAPLAYAQGTSSSGALVREAQTCDHMVFRGTYRELSVVIYGSRAPHAHTGPQEPGAGAGEGEELSLGALARLVHKVQEPMSDEEGGEGGGRASPDAAHARHHGLLQQAVSEWRASLQQQLPPSCSTSLAKQLVAAAAAAAESPRQELQQPRSGDDGEGGSPRGASRSQQQQRQQHGEAEVEEEEEEEVKVVMSWLHHALKPDPPFPQIESVEGLLAAVRLVATCRRRSYLFVAAGGLDLLIELLQRPWAGGSSSLRRQGLCAVEATCRHVFAIEALLGWWRPRAGAASAAAARAPLGGGKGDGAGAESAAYRALLGLLLKPAAVAAAPGVVHAGTAPLARLLLRVSAYHLVASLQAAAEHLLPLPFHKAEAEAEAVAEAESEVMVALGVPSSAPKQQQQLVTRTRRIASLLRVMEVDLGVPDDRPPAVAAAHWLAQDPLSPSASLSRLQPPDGARVCPDLDPCLVTILKERRVLPLLAALAAAVLPPLTAAAAAAEGRQQGQQQATLALWYALQMLLLPLLSTPSGQRLLASEQQVVASLASSLLLLRGPGQPAPPGTGSFSLSSWRSLAALTGVGLVAPAVLVSGTLTGALAAVRAADALLAAAASPPGPSSSSSSRRVVAPLLELAALARCHHSACPRCLPACARSQDQFLHSITCVCTCVQCESESVWMPCSCGGGRGGVPQAGRRWTL